jgi:predicted transcriptional regulator
VSKERKVNIAARVPPALAAAVADLAERGNRSVSREVAQAVAEHVKESSVMAAAPTSSAARSAAPLERGEARASRLAGKRLTPAAPDGSGPPGGARPREAA